MMKLKKLFCFTNILIVCACVLMNAGAQTIHSFEFPKDSDEFEGNTDEFLVKNGFHTCIEKGKLLSISSFGVPVAYVSPEVQVSGAEYMLFSLECAQISPDAKIDVKIKYEDSTEQLNTLELRDTKAHIYAVSVENQNSKIVGFEIFPQISADFSSMYSVYLDFVRFESSDTLTILGIGETTMYTSGQMLEIDAPAIISDSRTLTPARYVAQSLGAEVDWDESLKKVTITKEDTQIVLTIDSDTALVNGTEVKLDCKAVIVEGRTYTPARFVAENLMYEVSWDDNTKTVVING